VQTGDELNGRYRLEALLAVSGMAQLFRARVLGQGRMRVIKTVHPGARVDAGAVDALKREVDLCEQLSHDNIVRVLDFCVSENGEPYIVMEFIEGQPLNEYLQDRGNRLDEDTFVAFSTQILDAVAYAHKKGVIHRDLKPTNIIVQPHGAVKVLDFGIAAAVGDRAGADWLTAEYSSPEQIRQEPAAPSMDIYALGCVFYRLLAGRPPCIGTEDEVRAQHLGSNEVEPIPGVSPALNRVILRCLCKDRARRYQSVEEILGDLVTRTEFPIVLVALLAVVVGAIVVLSVSQPERITVRRVEPGISASRSGQSGIALGSGSAAPAARTPESRPLPPAESWTPETRISRTPSGTQTQVFPADGSRQGARRGVTPQAFRGGGGTLARSAATVAPEVPIVQQPLRVMPPVVPIPTRFSAPPVGISPTPTGLPGALGMPPIEPTGGGSQFVPVAPAADAQPTAVQRNPDGGDILNDSIDVHWVLANRYFKEGNYDRAVYELDLILKADPAHTNARDLRTLAESRKRSAAQSGR